MNESNSGARVFFCEMVKKRLIIQMTDLYGYMGLSEKCGFTDLDFRDIEGTELYVSAEAEEEIRRRLKEYGPGGIHLLDNGNYHYLTRFFLEKITVPFDLLTFDNHTDDKPCAFPGMRSCGSWIRDAREDISLLSSVKIIQSGGQVTLYGEPDLNRPLYLSIDKDILSREELTTNWDQGEMKLPELLSFILTECGGRELIGADIAGECAMAQGFFDTEEVRGNMDADLKLISVLEDVMKMA